MTDREPGNAPVDAPGAADEVVGASIDVGATSVHLLVAAVAAHDVRPLHDASVFLGLGDRVAADGRFGPAAREALVRALADYAAIARQLGALGIVAAGTEPLRQADDAGTVVHEVEQRAGIPLHVLEPREEGLLTLLGVTLGRPIGSPLLIVGVGGGSSEFILADALGVRHASGLRLGAARLTREIIAGDPPTASELEAARERARQILRAAPEIHPDKIIAVGGTADNLCKVVPDAALDRILTRSRLAEVLVRMTAEPSAELAAHHLLRPERARILPAGAIILDALLEHLGSDEARVSGGGMREGLVLAAIEAGPSWRDRLSVLVRGWE